MDGDDILFTTWHTSVKGMNIARNGRIALCVDDDKPPFAYAIIEGTATLTDDPAQLLYWATRIAGRYMGADLAESYGKRNGVAGELLVRVTPAKILAYTGISD